VILSDSHLLLRPDVLYARDDRSAKSLRLETREDIYEMSVDGTDAVSAVLPRLIGDVVLSKLAADIQLQPRDLARMLEPLVTHDLVLDLDATLRADTTAAFLDELRRECRFWGMALLAQPFWQEVLSGRAPLGTLYGWGMEFRHFADGANEYMAAGVAFCRDGADMRERLSRHYIEECTHGEIFLQGLVECGLPEKAITQAVPLATTRALINYLWDVAAEGTVTYCATFMLMQTHESSKPAADLFLQALCDLYPRAAALFQSFHRHTVLDLALNHHDNVFEQLCKERGELSPADRECALRTVRNLAEHFGAFFEGIRVHYTDEAAVMARRPRSSAYLEAGHVGG
jgi:pyrroloquinoline quinone (PQQ) biosynthesis protein C